MLEVARAAIEEYDAQAAWQQTLPFSIGAGLTSQLSTGSIIVPGQEYWQITSAGGFTTVDNGLLLVVSGDISLGLGVTNIKVSVAGAPGNALPGTIHLPIFFNNDPTGLDHTISVSLQGVTCMPGDQIRLIVALKNNDAVARNVTAGGFAMRYRPFRMVSEAAVALLNNQRIDPGLDQRLRMSRG